VCTRWVSLAETPVDYQFFVHLLDSSDQVVTQADFQPLEGHYPTSAWAQGEVVRVCTSLTAPGLPDGGWRVALGMYDLATLARLPATGSGTIENDAAFFTP
jgi:hypothetical protein